MSNISWFPSTSGGNVLMSFLQSFSGEPGQDISYMVNKDILA